MTPVIEEAVLGSDLDCEFYSLLNVNALVPVPSNLATSDDVRLTDVRAPMPGSVTNASVSATAAIDQSKLNLNGQIPSAWLGATATTAAQGDLAEYIVNKNVPGGYCGLDSAGKVPSSQLPDAVGLATVTSVGLSMPPEFIIDLPNPIVTSGTLSVHWAVVTNPSWFGCISGSVPSFQTGPLPAALIPNLDASLVNTGIFSPLRIPLAIYGTGHAKGAIPDPGASGTVTDYLSREMNYKPAPTIAASYQPVLPTPTVSVSDVPAGGTVTVFAGSTVADVTFFYSVTSAIAGFIEFPNPGYVAIDPVTAPSGIWIYSSRVGWNNSAIFHKPAPIFP